MHRAPTTATLSDTSLIDSLMDPLAFNHPVTDVEMLETHISWLILTDEYAYKIKKPIVLDFLDFGDLERRKFYCEEEIRLNRRWAPGIYLDVVAITLDNGQARFDGPGEAVEYAVRMRRFAADLRLDRQLELGLLSVADMKELALKIAERHTQAPAVKHDRRAKVIALTKEFMWDNLSALDGFINDATLDLLKDWTSNELRVAEPLLSQRFDDGFVRDCHGDLHLANLVRLPDGLTTFDCIEFNTDLRHIDVMCDIAFLIMDLVERKRHDLAAHFLNRYLEVSGDYGGVTVLNLFFVYRCLVRAKVAVIRSRERRDAKTRDDDIDEACSYCDMAVRQIAGHVPVLVIMHGLSGSGKTWVSGQLMAALPAVRVRSDIERKRMTGLSERASSHSEVGGGIYTEDANRDVYDRLLSTAAAILAAGHNVIIDAAFLKEEQRSAALRVADRCDCPATIVEVVAGGDVLRERIAQRAQDKSTASEANLEVLNHQIATAETLTSTEKGIAITCENSGSFDADAISQKIKEAVKELS